MSRILVVDDEPDIEVLILQKFRRQVHSGTFSFAFARDGVEALARVGSDAVFDLVLADINMPRMDGLTLLERLQEAVEPVATVIVSAYGDMTNIRTAMNRGAFDFLTKPVDFADLETTLAKTLRHVASQRDQKTRRLAAERAHAALARYFSPALATELAAETRRLDLRGQRRDVTALFTDISGFTALVEGLEPAVLADLLNEYFAGMTEIVFAAGGTVTKVMGDALHVLFGVPEEQDDHPARAVACALALDTFAQTFAIERRARGIGIGATRIGIHTGQALVGDFGGGRFFDYSAYGDTINLAARLEQANKSLGTRICASCQVADRAPGTIFRPIGDALIRGRRDPLRLYEPLTGDMAATTAAYRAAFDKLAAGDRGALPAFAALVGVNEDDPLANYHLRRLLNGESGVAIDLS